MEFKDLFEAIEFLFVDVLLIPFDLIRLEISNWIIQNALNFTFVVIISAALIYWTLELIKYDKKGEKNKDVTAHTLSYKSNPISCLKVFPSKFILSILL